MLTVHLMYHKDGDHLTIIEKPWWTPIYEWLVNRICPCCGLTGWLAGKSEKFEVAIYKLWSSLLHFTFRFEKTLYELPVTNACEISRAIFEKQIPCWRSDCEFCWDLQDDAYNSKGGD